MRGREQAPVVVACRPGEYERLTESVDKARHVELSALTGKLPPQPIPDLGRSRPLDAGTGNTGAEPG